MSISKAPKGFHWVRLDLSIQWARSRKGLGLPNGFLPKHEAQALIQTTLGMALDVSPPLQGAHCRSCSIHTDWREAQIGLRVVDAAEGQALNHQYRGKAYATNVLTFAYAHDPALCADIVLCAPVLAKEALEQQRDLQAHYAHMLAHGTLHALGLDHERSSKEEKLMQSLEARVLQHFGLCNPYES